MRATRVRSDGQVRAEVRTWPDEAVIPVPAEFGLLATIVERLLEQVGGPHAKAERARFDDASWVGFRLAELLPLAAVERQELLVLTDPLQRLDALMRLLPRFQQA